jgi:3-dehydroquinate synthase/shikimate kinase/3-dehydroquinate synthase
MNLQKISIKNSTSNYSIFIGKNILNILPKKIKKISINAKKIGIVFDKNVPSHYKFLLKKLLKNYKIYFFEYSSSEKLKSFSNTNKLVEKCLSYNFNRSDILIAVGGGIVGDFSGFVASLIKRGINFINIPTTLLAQVDSSIGGKTGVNSSHGKNLIGSFYQPKLVVSDVSFLKSLPKREMICGYAEILKHSLILENNFFNWLNKNTQKLLQNKDSELISKAIYQSCKIKLHFVKADVNEKNFRMTLNFGHTFAHAIEAKNNFSRKINHGEAVLMGMMLATKLSYLKNICSKSTLLSITNIYKKNKINYKINKFFKSGEYNKIISYMKNDKKNNDEKINLILLKRIGKTTIPGKFKLSTKSLKKIFKKII